MQYNAIRFTDGSIEPCLNVSYSVGHMGANKLEDVMLIQAMISLICQVERSWVGLDEAGYSVPEITGIMDADTYTAIGQFQIRNKDRLLMTMYDDRIDPAHYGHRRLPRNLHRMMSIMLLHQMATDACVLGSFPTDDRSDDLSYRGGLVKLNPMLKGKIDSARDMHVIEATD